MENLLLYPNKYSNSPTIEFMLNGHFLIEGKSTLENSKVFYEPVIKWLNEYYLQPADNINVDIKLEYFNTSSSKFILDIFRILEKLQINKLSKVHINWYYEEDDQDIEEAGMDYESIVRVPFTLKIIE
jgi:hypothetical protein